MNYHTYTGLSIAVVIFTGILYFSDPNIFIPLIGRINPLAASVILICLGFISLTFLEHKKWLTAFKKSNLKEIFLSAIVALLFVPVSIFIDIKVGFWKDLNILFPESLLFYPAIGFVVEILFHVIPLAMLLFLITSFFKNLNQQKAVMAGIIIVSLLEPVYQTRLMFSSTHFPVWSSVLVLLNLIAFNLSQLMIFKQYGFFSMYTFRFVYYFVWHIVWGYLRLQWLF